MKEQHYTIPLNEAMEAQDECPFCFIERAVEQDVMDFCLGNSSSYMEADIREATDKAGFCRMHFKKMFDYDNTLGNAWILLTHYLRTRRKMPPVTYAITLRTIIPAIWILFSICTAGTRTSGKR